MRPSFHQVAFEVAFQGMKIVLDTMIRKVCLLSSDNDGRVGLDPNVKKFLVIVMDMEVEDVNR